MVMVMLTIMIIRKKIWATCIVLSSTAISETKPLSPLSVVQNNATTLHQSTSYLVHLSTLLRPSLYLIDSRNSSMPPSALPAKPFVNRTGPERFRSTGTGAQPTSTVEWFTATDHGTGCTVSLCPVPNRSTKSSRKWPANQILASTPCSTTKKFVSSKTFFMRGTRLQQPGQLSSWPSSRV